MPMRQGETGMQLNNLNTAAKLGLSGFLLTIIIGVLSAATLIGLLYSSYDAGFRMAEIDKVKAKYSSALLVGAMRTSMYPYVTVDEDIDTIANWVDDGSPNNAFFSAEVMPIIEADCQNCHSKTSTMTGAIPSLPLSNYADIQPYTAKGYSWTHMAQSAHIHLLGIALIIILVCLPMAMTAYRSGLKTSLISIAWLALWLDIASWWLAKLSDVFAYVIAVSGTFMLGAIVAMCGLCLLDLWAKIPAWLRG